MQHPAGSRGHIDHKFHDILELAHIAGPRVGGERREHVRAERRSLFVEPGAVAGEEVGRQQLDVAVALAQGRNL